MANAWFNQPIFLFNPVSWNHPKYVPWFDILLLDLDNALLQQSNVVKGEHCHKVQSVLGNQHIFEFKSTNGSDGYVTQVG